MVAPALGPVLSGYLLQYADWRLIFLINVPIGVIAFYVGHRVLPNLAAGRAAGRLDIPGMILGPLAFVALSFGISASIAAGWTAPATVGGITIGLITLALFVWRELATFDPVLELRVFARRDFTLAMLTQWAVICVMFGTFFMVPLFLQQVRGFGALETGLITLPMAIGSAIFMQIGGRAFDRVGARPPILFGVSALVVSMWLFTRWTDATAGLELLLPLALAGSGMGAMMPPLSSYLLNNAPRELVGRVTSLQAALQNVVGSLAIATFATLLQVWSFPDVFRVCLVLALVAFGLAWTLRRSAPVADETAEAQPRPLVHEALA
jgi:EmrB/QacA subfamily drug resistance transporter